MENQDYKIPLGICRQACMKLDSFIQDIHEIKEDPDLDPEDANTFAVIAEVAGVMMAHIVNIVTKECGEEEFLSEDFPMDEIAGYPEMEPDDIMDGLMDTTELE